MLLFFKLVFIFSIFHDKFLFPQGKLHKHEASYHDVVNDANETKITKTWEQIAKFNEYIDPGKHDKSESGEEIVSDERLLLKT